MAKAKFMNGEFSAKFKGKRRFVAEQMEAIKDYAARDQYLSGNPGETFWKKEY